MCAQRKSEHAAPPPGRCARSAVRVLSFFFFLVAVDRSAVHSHVFSVLYEMPCVVPTLYRPYKLGITRASRIPPPFALILRGSSKQNQNRT